MSDPLSIPLSTEVSAERTGPATPIPAPTLPPASDHLKPLLNPIQVDAPPPSSTIVEAPKSPNPSNPATDNLGSNNGVASIGELVANGPEDVTMGQSAPAPIADQSFEERVNSDTQPPLPIDAPVPPTPPAPSDEVPPELPPDAIPPAVSTPTVITTEDPIQAPAEPVVPTPVEDLAEQPILSATPAEAAADLMSAPPPPPALEASPSAPAPSTDISTPIVPVSTETATLATLEPSHVEAPNAPLEEKMEVDAVEEAEGSASTAVAPPLQTTSSSGSMKRAGEDLPGREEKRVKEDEEIKVDVPPTNAAPIPSVVPVATPVAPAVPAAPAPTPVGTVPTNYVPTQFGDPGPTTPLTLNQHKHFLAVLRSMKKQKEWLNFAVPVDVVAFNIPHYHNIVKNPMDLGTVETKTIVSDPRGPPKDKSKMKNWDESKGKYGSVSEITQDVRQVWENTRMFNGPEHIVSLAANKLESNWEAALKRIPPEPSQAPPPPIFSAPIASPAAAGPSQSPHPRRASVSQPPVIRRTSDGDRPKREIHPPPSKELPYADGVRKPKRRNDSQLRWAERIVKQIETKHYNSASPFLYPVENLIRDLPDYAKHIKKPIDLNIIKNKLAEGEYDDVQQVDDDMRLMVANATRYNPAGDPVHSAALQLEQAWKEKWADLPPKETPREESEDPLAGGIGEDDEDDEDEATITQLQKQINDLQKRIDDIRDRKSRKGGKGKAKAKPSARKQSMSKGSPSTGANGHAKKPRKSKDYDDDDSEDEVTNLTLTQKQELATKIQLADGDTLQKAIHIIQQSTPLGANDEIELDIDSLPAPAVVKLYNLVCRGGTKARRPKAQTALGQQKKPGRKATGGFGRKSMNEQEEAARIKRMEAQLQSFDSRPQYEESDDESSEEEDSDEE